MVFKKITLVGRSTENFEGAIENAIDRAEKTLENLMWVSVVTQTVELEGLSASIRLKSRSHSNSTRARYEDSQNQVPR
jgi:flavin-binding protein dodecin